MRPAPRRPARSAAAPRTAIALLLALLLAGCGRQQPPLRIVLVTLDTLRQDSLQGQGATMPGLWQAASEGLLFEQFWSATSSTQPSHASMFTGLHPWQHGVTRNGLVLAPELETVAERLQEAGFSTAAVVASFPLEARFGFTQGFDSYVDDFDLGRGGRTWNEQAVEEGRFYSLAPAVTERALAALDAASGLRQFFWFHYYDPHAPYGDTGEEVIAARELVATAQKDQPRMEALLADARRLYDRDVAVLDACLQRLLARLREDGGDTHVLLVSDHGESFGEDGGVLGHGNHLVRPQLQVPAVLLSPRVQAGRRADPAGSADIAPTLLALAGLPVDDRLAGRNLLAAGQAGRGVFGMRRSYAGPTSEVRADGSTEVLEGARFFLVRDERLYTGDGRDVRCDAPDAPADHLQTARQLFAAFELELGGQDPTELMDGETRAAMEALGYVR